VIINVGMNGANLVLTGAGAQQGRCVDALGQSLIGEVSGCNAVRFYNLANFEIARGILKVPPAGTALDGKPCPTSRDFSVVDQDQSDNVVSTYLLNGQGQTAQFSAANQAALAGATPIVNPSDNLVLGKFIDPANGCTPFMAPDTTAPNGTSPSQALDELSARVNQQAPIAVIPPNDPMVLVGGNMSVAKTNVYRSLNDMPLLPNNVNPTQVAASYCQNLVNVQPARLQLDMAREANATSPVAAVGNNLATFLGARLSASFTNLVCNSFGLKNPVNLTLTNNVATAVTYNLTQQQATGAGAAAGAGGGATGNQNPPGGRRHHHHFM
jgi:hypothetical protein